jgi:hypothetical protein
MRFMSTSTRIALSLVVLVSVGGVAVVVGAPIQWPVNGHYYECVATPLTWRSACTAAAAASYQGWPGHLASIGSLSENSFVTTQVIGSPFPDASGHVWVGGYQPVGSGEPSSAWGWSTGEAWTYTNWSPVEPNNGWDGQGDEDCLALTSNGPGLWNDICGGQCHPYVIEYEPGSLGACPTVTTSCLDMGLGCDGSQVPGAPALTRWGSVALVLLLGLGGALILARRKTQALS